MLFTRHLGFKGSSAVLACAIAAFGGSIVAKAADMPLGKSARPPAAYVEFCHMRPGECGKTGPDLDRPLAMYPYPSRRPKNVWEEAFSQAKLNSTLRTGAVSAGHAGTDIILDGDVESPLNEAALPTNSAGEPSAELPFPSPDVAWWQTEEFCGLDDDGGGKISPFASEVRLIRCDVGIGLQEAAYQSSRSPTHPGASSGRAGLSETQAPAFSLTPEGKRVLESINRRVNQAILPATDEEIYGVADFWTEPVTESLKAGEHLRYVYGDCEDYVLEKRHQLIAAGVDPENLSIAVVQTRHGALHAVLLVRTDLGELVMDNLSQSLLEWQNAPYHWVMRQVLGRAEDWRTVPLPIGRV